MHLLGNGRQPFLEFLRNLTPQALLLTLTISLWTQLDFGRFDISNWLTTLAFYSCIVTWILAVIANMQQFIEAYSPLALAPFEQRMAKGVRRLPNIQARARFLARSVIRFRWAVASHLVIVMLLVQIGFFAATWFGVQQAVRLLSKQ